MNMVRVLTTIVVCGCAAAVAAPVPKNLKPALEPLAHFHFNGDGKNEVKGGAEFDLNNIEFKDNALFLNGLYENSGIKGAYRAVCKTPGLDYNEFTVAMRFKAVEFGQNKSNLFMGGTSYRWFGLERSQDGNLIVTFNNGSFGEEIKAAALDKGEWTVVACSVDLPNRKVTVALNGRRRSG